MGDCIMSDLNTSWRTPPLARVVAPLDGMVVVGWITSTYSDDGQLRFGPFATIEQAQHWADSLSNGSTIYPLYGASYSH
jgi:hypothetical protein